MKDLIYPDIKTAEEVRAICNALGATDSTSPDIKFVEDCAVPIESISPMVLGEQQFGMAQGGEVGMAAQFARRRDSGFTQNP